MPLGTWPLNLSTYNIIRVMVPHVETFWVYITLWKLTHLRKACNESEFVIIDDSSVGFGRGQNTTSIIRTTSGPCSAVSLLFYIGAHIHICAQTSSI